MLLSASVLALALAAPAWTPVGPPGGDVRSLAADPRDPRRLYLGTADGVAYRSDDAGLSWSRLAPGFPRRGQSLDEMAVSPTGALYVAYWQVTGGDGGGVAVSRDGGLTFRILPGIEGESVRALALQGDTLVAGSLQGVFRSGDEGETWDRITPLGHPELRMVESVAIDPADPATVYVGTWHLPWKTTDGGKTWDLVHTGMIEDSDVFTMVLDRRDPQRVWATACSGIYRSGDGAARWTRMRGIPSTSRRTRSFAQDRDQPDTFYAGTTEGLWITPDVGGTWAARTGTNLVINAVVTLPGLVLLGTEGAGVLRSTDGGTSWVDSNRGFSERFVRRIAFDPQGSRVAVGIGGDRQHSGVFAAASADGPWQRLAPGLEGRELLSLAFSEGRVLAGTDAGIFRFDSTWQRLPAADAAGIHPRISDVVALGPGTLLAATSRGLLHSTDAGTSWHFTDLPAGSTVTALAASPRDPRVALAASPLGLHRTADGGETWAAVTQGLSADIRHLAVLADGVLLAASSQGLLRSINDGRSWHKVPGLPAIDVTGLAAADGRTLYASDFKFGGIYRSTDSGATWSRLPSDGLLSDRVWAVAADPRAPDRVLASPSTGGLQLLSGTPGASTAAR